MEKFTKFMPMGLFCFYFIKLGVIGASFPDALVMFFMAALLFGLHQQIKSARLSDIEQEIKDVRLHLESNKKEISEIRSYVTGQKLGTLRATQNGRQL